MRRKTGEAKEIEVNNDQAEKKEDTIPRIEPKTSNKKTEEKKAGKKNLGDLKTTSVDIMHLNVRSLFNKIDQLELLMQDNYSEIDIICLSETWLKETQMQTAHLNGFQLASYMTRKGVRGGGVCMFIRKDSRVTFETRSDICKMSIEREMEICAIELLTPVSIVIVTIYRAPEASKYDQFLAQLETIIQTASKKRSKVIIIGDFNYNINNVRLRHCLEETIFLHDFKIINFGDTRIAHMKSKRSQSCIDNVLSNDNSIVFKGNVEVGLSDHLGQVVSVPYAEKATNHNKHIKKRLTRSFNDRQVDLFMIGISSVSWDNVHTADNVNEMFKRFMHLFMNEFNKAFPYKEMRIQKTRKNRKTNEWYTEELKLLADNVIDLECKFYRSGNLNDKLNYEKAKRTYKREIKHSKTLHNENKIRHSKNKSKTAWNIIDSCKTNTEQSRDNIKIRHESNLIESETEVANIFNNYFSNIVPELLKSRGKLNRAQNNDKKITRIIQDQIFLAPVSRKEIHEIADKALNKFSAGHDDVPARIIKKIITFIAEPLTVIINASFEQGTFPDTLKKALIRPIFKKGDRQSVCNYRPITILSSFSKIFELTMCNRIINFATKYDILNDAQHGFRKGRSTTSAVGSFISKTIRALEDKQAAIGVFYDFSKAFDTINHKLLLEKLKHMGISGNANKWIESFLKDRKQVVKINGVNGSSISQETTTNVGMPQGATISPLLFILFTNDITNCVDKGSLTLYADDTSHLVCGKDLTTVDLSLRSEVKSIEEWCLNNDLIINTPKTILMEFNYKNTDSDFPPISIQGATIKNIQTTNFLGITVDNNLDWKSHISQTCLKISSGCYLIKRIMQTCNLETAKLVYFAYIESRLRYGIELWGQSPYAKRLFILQKRCLRILGKASKDPCAKIYYKDSCSTLFKQYCILTLPSLYIYQTIMYVLNNDQLCTINLEIHDHLTRSRKEFYLKKNNLKKSDKCPMYAGAILFNNLPDNIKNKTGDNFKCELKQYLLEKCFYKVDDYLSL